MTKSRARLTSSSPVLVLALSLWASLWGRGYAQIIDIDAVKREGELLFYSATRAEDTDQLVKAFTKKYPFIKGTYYRAGGDPLLQRILTEARGGESIYSMSLPPWALR
jgi:ABC-type glycerol-3-phosphate transport system substrate-binding protein